MPTLTLIADDYAMTAGVSRGILRLLEHGRIAGTGAMTNRPHWKGWSHALRGFQGQADIGVHLNLTLGQPLTDMPLLAPGGDLPSIGEIAKGALARRLPVEEIAGEIDAQLDASSRRRTGGRISSTATSMCMGWPACAAPCSPC